MASKREDSPRPRAGDCPHSNFRLSEFPRCGSWVLMCVDCVRGEPMEMSSGWITWWTCRPAISCRSCPSRVANVGLTSSRRDWSGVSIGIGLRANRNRYLPAQRAAVRRGRCVRMFGSAFGGGWFNPRGDGGAGSPSGCLIRRTGPVPGRADAGGGPSEERHGGGRRCMSGSTRPRGAGERPGAIAIS